MRIFYVYIVLCSDSTYYVGITNDLVRRILEHNSGKFQNSYTAHRRPVKLVFSEKLFDPSEAIRREKQIKRWGQAKKKALIAGDFKSLPHLSKSKSS
ncbi:MAG: GIY-YIG nuclease family protein [Bacteroidetes bacterium]|nr:GIY-YIG nuclease family protein [Bacteroidota bacterium]